MTFSQAAQTLIQSHDATQLTALGRWLTGWLVAQLMAAEPGDWPAESTPGQPPPFGESRARALLRAGELVDDGALGRLEGLLASPTAVRVTLADLLDQTGLAANETVAATHLPATDEAAVPWLTLILAAFAWRADYPLAQLDPASPPTPHSPAGQVLRRSAHFVQQQLLRSATERDQLARRLAYRGEPASREGGGETIAPLPPHFRPPIPVRYPEVARETLHVDPDAASGSPPPVTRGEPITIDESDLAAAATSAPQPAITIRREQTERRRPAPEARRRGLPEAVSDAGNSLATAVRQFFQREPLDSTRLRVFAQEHPDGPGLYGLQVRVTCPGIRSHVAGTTGRDGQFLCELPVPRDRGLTYDVDLSWPREAGGEVERKSITLHADRTEFKLPFYRRLNP